jgi:hypothetical protein
MKSFHIGITIIHTAPCGNTCHSHKSVTPQEINENLTMPCSAVNTTTSNSGGATCSRK